MELRENLGCLQFICLVFVGCSVFADVVFRIVTQRWNNGIFIAFLIALILTAIVSLMMKSYDIGFMAGWDLAKTPMTEESKDE